MDYAVRVGPALQHAASMAVMWAALQVQQDLTVLNAYRVRAEMGRTEGDREAALQYADLIINRYTGHNSITEARDPYAELRNTWRWINDNPAMASVQQRNESPPNEPDGSEAA